MRFIELFCGIGGFRLGLERIGFECVWSNDIDKYACQIYRKHWGKVNEGDIRAVEADTIPRYNLLTAGFPCQSFSNAGKRRGFDDTRGTLFFEIGRIARVQKPQYLLLENVRELLQHDGGQTFYIILQSLDELGYDCQWQVLDSRDFGSPQKRLRLFIIGYLRGKTKRELLPIKRTAYVCDNTHLGTEDEGLWLPTLPALYNKSLGQGPFIEEEGRFRILTPTEYERAQGFPDGWTEGISDTQRYKCVGNAVHPNVIEAIGRQWGNEVEGDIELGVTND